MNFRLMILHAFFTYCVPALCMSVVNPGPKYPATKGAVWPKPRNQVVLKEVYLFDPSDFEIKVTGYTCDILKNAVERYLYIIRDYADLSKKSDRRSKPDYVQLHRRSFIEKLQNIKQLRIELKEPCEGYPHYGMDETYCLNVTTASDLKSASIWGVLRGLESFAQMFYYSDNYNEIFINGTLIYDYPRYSHRGILLDTSRHYFSVRTILKILDAMAMNKMNVFHWHIVDDQSFPYQSEKFPELSQYGAYAPSMIYTKTDIKKIIEFARQRGIRVLPEFDVPGHTRSWGVAYPNILTECYENDNMIGLGPIDPTSNVAYKLLKELFREVQDLFPDRYFHVGGDEVELNCWNSNPKLQQYMEENNMVASDLHAMFMKNVIPLLGRKSIPVVWQEVFDEDVPLMPNTLVQVWKDIGPGEMIRVLHAGYQVIFSSSWYLDHLTDDFGKFYLVDPRQKVYDATGNITLLQNIVGGEACMWGEMADDQNVLSRMWPRASAVAERLWSSGAGKSIAANFKTLNSARRRVEEHTCRMIRRGIPAQPANGPGFCVV